MTSEQTTARDRAQWLMAYLLDQPLEGYERSIKIGRRLLLDQRFLGGISFNRLQRAGLQEICRRLDMPQALVAAINAEGDEPDIVHFGYEGGASQDVFKVYFEFARRTTSPVAGSSFILHRAFKWDANSPHRRAVATYRCFVGLSSAKQRERITAILDGLSFLPMINQILDLSYPRCAEAPMYLEVSEEGNPRSSFDVNFHSAVMPLSLIHSVLLSNSQLFGLADGAVERALEPLHARALGHLSAGVSREGECFLTLYYDPFA